MLRLFILLGLALGAGILGWFIRGQTSLDQLPGNRTSDIGPILERIHMLSSLTTLRVDVADAVVTELQGRTGGITAVLVVHGEATLGVDLSQAKFQSINPKQRIAVLLLPQPRTEMVKLDHQKTKLIGLNTSGLWMIVPGGDDADAVISDLAYQRGEELVASAAAHPELAEQARNQAERVISSFFEAISWKMKVRWSG
jgi:hypothetical protein